MSMLGTWSLVLLGAVSTAQAAGFDCAKAATKVEKQVCADVALSKLDGELAAEYQAAKLRADRPTALKAEQQAWLAKRNACKDLACLRAAYEGRLAELRERERHRFPDLASASAGSCASFAAVAGSNPADCHVTGSGKFGALAG